MLEMAVGRNFARGLAAMLKGNTIPTDFVACKEGCMRGM
jgi:hypothetical protein